LCVCSHIYIYMEQRERVVGRARTHTHRMSGDFVPVLLDLIPEAVASQKFHMNMGPILNGYGIRVSEMRHAGAGVDMFIGKPAQQQHLASKQCSQSLGTSHNIRMSQVPDRWRSA
jgi:hypothetical protein